MINMGCVIKLIDVDGNDIPYERVSVLPSRLHQEKCDIITIQLLGDLPDITNDELRLITSAIVERIHLGDSESKIRKYIEILDKIDKLIERK